MVKFYWKAIWEYLYDFFLNFKSVIFFSIKLFICVTILAIIQMNLWSVVVSSLGHFWFFVTPWTAARQASLSFTISQRLLKLMSIESMMPSNHLILCHLLLFPALSLAQHQDFFLWVGSFHHLPKGVELQLQHQPFQWTFSADFL